MKVLAIDSGMHPNELSPTSRESTKKILNLFSKSTYNKNKKFFNKKLSFYSIKSSYNLFIKQTTHTTTCAISEVIKKQKSK